MRAGFTQGEAAVPLSDGLPLSLPLCPSSPALTRWHQSLRIGGGENEALELKNLQLVAKLLQVFELLTLLSETL